MIRFETVNELALKVTCQGGGVLYTKAGAFSTQRRARLSRGRVLAGRTIRLRRFCLARSRGCCRRRSVR